MRFNIKRVLVFTAAVLATAAAPAGDLIWSDEFSGTTLDPANWEAMIGDGTAYGTPPGWGNNELEYYTGRPANVSVSGGLLHIVARREPFAGYQYTSARLRTQGLQDFRYGRIEARIKLPATRGIWPAFWMLPTNSPYGGWAASGEIDIMESVNFATSIQATIHYGAPWPNNTSSGGLLFDGTIFSRDFHVYAIEWSPDEIRWFVDGVLYHTEASATWFSSAAPGNPRAPFDTPFHLLLNVAVGGNFPGPPDVSSQFPQEMLVDWVRVYSLDNQSPFLGAASSLPGRIEAEDFDLGGAGVAYVDCDFTNNGGAYRPDEQVDIEASTESGFDVGWMCPGEWIEYTIDARCAGEYVIETRVASLASGGSFAFCLDGTALTQSVLAPVSGGWQNWTTVRTSATLPAGTHILRFANRGAAGEEFNVNYFDFSLLGDLNHDNVIGLEDLSALLANFGAQDAGLAGDLDEDGDVDLEDLSRLLAGFGRNCQ